MHVHVRFHECGVSLLSSLVEVDVPAVASPSGEQNRFTLVSHSVCLCAPFLRSGTIASLHSGGCARRDCVGRTATRYRWAIRARAVSWSTVLLEKSPVDERAWNHDAGGGGGGRASG
eukprot:840231-Pleurochrysis_carterae.AAC.1